MQRETKLVADGHSTTRQCQNNSAGIVSIGFELRCQQSARFFPIMEDHRVSSPRSHGCNHTEGNQDASWVSCEALSTGVGPLTHMAFARRVFRRLAVCPWAIWTCFGPYVHIAKTMLRNRRSAASSMRMKATAPAAIIALYR